MMLRRSLLITVLMLSMILLASCVNVKQEIWINNDGTGRIAMDMGVSESLASMADNSDQNNGIPSADELKKTYTGNGNPYVKNAEVKQYNQDGYKHVQITYDVMDMEKYFAEQGKDGNKTSIITLQKLDNGNLLFKQVVGSPNVGANAEQSGSSQSTDTSMEELGKNLAQSAFAGQYWNIKVHVANVVSTNGTWDKEKGEVEWNIPMADLMNNKQSDMTLEYRPRPAWLKYLPWLVGGSLSLVLLIGLLLAIFFFVKRSRQPKVDAAIPPSNT